MAVTRIPTDLHVQGSLSATTIIPSDGSVTNAKVPAGASLDVEKLDHLHKPGTNFGYAIDATPTTREDIVFVASGTAIIRTFKALLADTGSSTDIKFDLKKNGVSVLSSTLDFTNADASGTVKNGTLSGTSLSADDVLSVTMTVTGSTGAEGPFAWVEIDEGAN